MSSFPYAIIYRKNGAWKFILPDNENACASIDRITSSRILEDDHRECNNDSKGVEIEA